jgi:hypothetical protein
MADADLNLIILAVSRLNVALCSVGVVPAMTIVRSTKEVISYIMDLLSQKLKTEDAEMVMD